VAARSGGSACLSQASLVDLIPELRPWAQRLFDVCDQAGASPTITSTIRSPAQQAQLYNDYIAGRSKYPAAKPGTSAHEFGWAFDLSMPLRGDEEQAGQVWRGWGGKWGGEEDLIHYEFPGFSPGRVATSAPALPPSFGTPGTISERLADFLISMVPGLRIIGISQLASALYSLVGGDENILTWWLSHPVEFVRDVFDEWRALLALIY